MRICSWVISLISFFPFASREGRFRADIEEVWERVKIVCVCVCERNKGHPTRDKEKIFSLSRMKCLKSKKYIYCCNDDKILWLFIEGDISFIIQIMTLKTFRFIENFMRCKRKFSKKNEKETLSATQLKPTFKKDRSALEREKERREDESDSFQICSFCALKSSGKCHFLI